RAETLHRSALDSDALRLEMRDCALDRALPFEAKIAIAGLHRQARNFSGLHARPVNVELLVAETIGPAGRPLHQFGAHDLAVELVRSVPIGDVNHAMIKLRRHSHDFTPSFASAARVRAPRSASSWFHACRALSGRGPAQSRPPPAPSR